MLERSRKHGISARSERVLSNRPLIRLSQLRAHPPLARIAEKVLRLGPNKAKPARCLEVERVNVRDTINPVNRLIYAQWSKPHTTQGLLPQELSIKLAAPLNFQQMWLINGQNGSHLLLRWVNPLTRLKTPVKRWCAPHVLVLEEKGRKDRRYNAGTHAPSVKLRQSAKGRTIGTREVVEERARRDRDQVLQTLGASLHARWKLGHDFIDIF